MIIRKATADDIDILVKVRLDYLTSYGDLTDEQIDAIRTQLITFYPCHINKDFVAYFVEICNQIAASAFLVISERPANPSFITGKTATLLNVFTYPEHRRRGVATTLLNTVTKEARESGICLIELSASETGKHLYEKLGFSEPGYTAMRLKL